MLVVTTEDTRVYPWQEQCWQQLQQQHSADHLPHALLLTGPAGCGKQHFAVQVVNYLLCHAPREDRACGDCKGCRLLRAGSHPDALLIEPEATGKAIKVDQIRRTAEFVAQTSQLGGYKSIIVAPAESLNINAANALLKILEEPGARTLFILVSSEPGRVAATVRSRCNRIALQMPDREQARSWLAQSLAGDAPLEALLDLAGNSPLVALQAHEGNALQQLEQLLETLLTVAERRKSPLEVASQLDKIETPVLLGWLQSLLSDLVKIKMLGGEAPLRFENERHLLCKFAEHISLHALYSYIDGVVRARQILLSGHNPNKLLLLEDLLISWSSACMTDRTQQATETKL